MKADIRRSIPTAGLALLIGTGFFTHAADWPQWRGPNRDGKANGFKAPQTWPASLNQKWKLSIGPGLASPAVVGGRVYLFARDQADEVLVCLNAETGQELWTNPDCSVQFNTPVLKNGRLYGIAQNGSIFCIDAKDGKTLWTAQFGGRDFGSIVDAGDVFFAMTPQSELTAFEPSDREFKKLAGYKVAETDVYAHPVIVGNSLIIKDQNSVALWTIE